jgi:HEAT repeat-containing protein 6
MKLLVYARKKSSIDIFIFISIQVKSNAARALGYLSRFIRFTHQANPINDPRFG